MFKIKIPVTLKIGPGVNTFGLALKRHLIVSVEDIEDEKTGILIQDNSSFFSEHNIVDIYTKIYNFFLKNYNIGNKNIKCSFYTDFDDLRFLNSNTSLAVAFIKIIDHVFKLELDEDRILIIYKKIFLDVENATAAFLGSLSVVDRDNVSFMSVPWPEKWNLSILICKEHSNCRDIRVPSYHDYFMDSNAKSAFFVSAVYSGQSSLLFKAMQDKLAYIANRGRIPFIEKINLLGRTTGTAGIGFLKEGCGVIIAGAPENLKRCIERVEKLYNRNSVDYNVFNFSIDNNGAEFCLE